MQYTGLRTFHKEFIAKMSYPLMITVFYCQETAQLKDWNEGSHGS
jgi:Cu/Ag efflux protein CusF